MSLFYSHMIAILRDTFPTISPRRFALQVVIVGDPAHTASNNLQVWNQHWQGFANISQHQRQNADSAKPPFVPNQATFVPPTEILLLQLPFKVSTCSNVDDILRNAGQFRGPDTLIQTNKNQISGLIHEQNGKSGNCFIRSLRA